MPDKYCHQCDKPLPTHKFRYCGDECRDKYRGRARKSPTQCKECGGELPPYKRLYCSDPCSIDGRRKRKRITQRRERARIKELVYEW